MNIKVRLSEESINRAISRLKWVKSYIDYGLENTISILVKDGEGIANAEYGSMANASGYMPDQETGIIAVTGDANLIAEFGAGDATESPLTMFENEPDTDVYPGSYSEQVGSGEYYRTRMASGGSGGYWHFGGKKFTEVRPRHGLLKAKQHIVKESTSVAKGVIKL